MTFRAACIQLNSQDDIPANIRAIETAIREAAGKGAQFILLPENAYAMIAPGENYKHPAGDHPGLIAAQSLAKELSLCILIGSIASHPSSCGLTAGFISAAPTLDPAVKPQDGEKGKKHNRSLLIDANGNIASSYDKIHLFDVCLPSGEKYEESARFLPGDCMALAQTPWGKLGLSVCYDVRFPHLYRALAKAGAEMLCIPAAFTHTTGKAHWHILLRARAIENGCYVFAPAQCGTHPGNRRTYGHSLIIDPWGEILAEASEDKPEIIYADIDLQKVTQARSMIPSLQHDREFRS